MTTDKHFEMGFFRMDGVDVEFVDRHMGPVRGFSPRRRKSTSFTGRYALDVESMRGFDRDVLDLQGTRPVPCVGDQLVVHKDHQQIRLRVVEVTREGTFVHPQQVGWIRLELA